MAFNNKVSISDKIGAMYKQTRNNTNVTFTLE